MSSYYRQRREADMTLYETGTTNEREYLEDVDTILAHYIEAALWSSLDEGGEPLDGNYGADDVAEATYDEMREDVEGFLSLLAENGVEWVGRVELEQMGHDFWLTRNHHGAGFWDRGLGDLGDRLTTWAQTFGEVDLYVHDGKVWQS